MTGWCQRWTGGREARRPAGELIEPGRYEVGLIPEAVARAFVLEHHYAHSYPASRLRCGLHRAGALVGVAVFSVPIQPAAARRWCGVLPAAAVELGRFVLLDDVPGNGETWFLARAFRLLREHKPDIEAVLSYSDPIERWSAAGELVKPGHIGTIYQAFNGRYLGRSSARTLLVSADGAVLSPRALSKIRLGERGSGYVEEQLVRAGAPARWLGESGASYLDRVDRIGAFRRIRHPGNLVYAWPLARSARLAPAQSYPKGAAA